MGRRKKILIVEDEKSVLDVFRRYLEDFCHYNVLTSRSCFEAFEIYSKNKSNLDLIILDESLPSMSSPEFAERIHNDEPSMKIMFKHHRGDLMNVKQYLEKGLFVSDFQVPLELDDLLEKVKSAIGGPLVEDSYRDFIHQLLLTLGFEEDHVISWVEKNINEIELMPFGFSIEKGYTGLGVVINKEWALKFDKMPRIEKEHRIYTSPDYGEYSLFVPAVKGFDVTDDGEYGALIFENLLARKKSGEIVAADLAAKYGIILNNNLDFNLFLMGLFHKCASTDEKLREKCGLVPYEDKRGIVHTLAANIPLDGISNDAYRRFMETAIPSQQVMEPIENYNSVLNAINQSKGLSVIHGDWKPENMANGYPVDFAMVGLAHEADELAYYLSDYRLRVNINKFHKLIDRYIEFRCKHDDKFYIRIQDKGKQATHQLADSAFLRQLVLRHSVMKKRDMRDDTKYKQRSYYKHMIGEFLRQGRFV